MDESPLPDRVGKGRDSRWLGQFTSYTPGGDDTNVTVLVALPPCAISVAATATLGGAGAAFTITALLYSYYTPFRWE